MSSPSQNELALRLEIEKPYPCGQDGNKYTPFPRRFQAGILKIEVLRARDGGGGRVREGEGVREGETSDLRPATCGDIVPFYDR